MLSGLRVLFMGADHQKPMLATPPSLCEDAALAFMYVSARLCTSTPVYLIHSTLENSSLSLELTLTQPPINNLKGFEIYH